MIIIPAAPHGLLNSLALHRPSGLPLSGAIGLGILASIHLVHLGDQGIVHGEFAALLLQNARRIDH